MKYFLIAFLCYFAVISVVTALVTFTDKRNAKKNRRRVPEATLFILAFLGGSVSEYAVMRLIRHKTLHKRFMIGLPVIMVFQIAVSVFILSQII